MSERIERLAKGFAELGRILFLSHPNELTENILVPLRGHDKSAFGVSLYVITDPLPDGSCTYWVAADLCKADLTPDCSNRYKTTNLMREYLCTPEEPRDSGFTPKDAACNMLHSMRHDWAGKVDTALRLAAESMSVPDHAFLLPVLEPADD